MKKKYTIFAGFLFCALLAASIWVQQQEPPQTQGSLPKWAALWEARGAKPVADEAANKAFAKDFPVAVENEYPIGSSPEKILSDCKALGYKYTSKEMLPANTIFTKDYPCRFSMCGSVHPYQDSGETVTVSWCDEGGKVTWIRGRFGSYID